MQFRHQNFPYPNLNFTLISNKKQKAKKYQKFIDYTRTNKKWRAYCWYETRILDSTITYYHPDIKWRNTFQQAYPSQEHTESGFQSGLVNGGGGQTDCYMPLRQQKGDYRDKIKAPLPTVYFFTANPLDTKKTTMYSISSLETSETPPYKF
jgi:hypothetical protein